MKVLLYSHEADPVCQVLLEEGSPSGIIPLSVEEVLHEAFITHQERKNLPPLITWDIPGKVVLRSDENHRIINRILDIPWSRLQTVQEEDQIYFYKEMYSYLSWSLPHFHESSSYPDLFGLGLGKRPLHYQWREVERANLPLKIPSHFYGFREDNPFNYFCESEDKGTLVFSDPSLIYDFRGAPGPLPDQPKDKNVFCFLKPSGRPYQTFLCYDRVTVSPLKGGPDPERRMGQNLEDYSRILADFFRLRMAEILFFVEGEEITFGMISPTLRGCRTIPGFGQTLKEAL